MTPRRAMINRLLVSAPWVTIAAMIALSFALPNSTAGVEPDVRRNAEIAHAIHEIPLFIGRWVNDENYARSSIPHEAQKLLKPNAIAQRHYTSPGDPTVHLVVVHCGDARDMIGHYPPICYPSAGWEPIDQPNQDLVLSVNGWPLPVREYGFKGYLEGGREDVIRIFNAFVLPDGTATRDIDDIHRQSERLSVAVQGVAQLQVITPGRVSDEEAIAAAEEILGGLGAMFESLGVTPAGDGGDGRGASK
jgi:hypothetical protein